MRMEWKERATGDKMEEEPRVGTNHEGQPSGASGSGHPHNGKGCDRKRKEDGCHDRKSEGRKSMGSDAPGSGVSDATSMGAIVRARFGGSAADNDAWIAHVRERTRALSEGALANRRGPGSGSSQGLFIERNVRARPGDVQSSNGSKGRICPSPYAWNAGNWGYSRLASGDVCHSSYSVY